MNRRYLKMWAEKYKSAKSSLIAWQKQMEQIEDVHLFWEVFKRRASQISNKNYKYLTIFNIKGNDYRLAVDIIFDRKEVYLKWFGAHAKYDKIPWKKTNLKGVE